MPCNYQPDGEMWRQVTTYLKAILGGRFDQILANIPRTMPSWSKLHIREGGDRIQTLEFFRRYRESRRDNTFVRVCHTMATNEKYNIDTFCT
jgi:hypothetical protein